MNLTNWSVSEEFEVKKDCSCISWNQSPFEAPTMVVGGGHQANIWEFQEKVRKWQCVLDLEGHGSTVHDVSWAPNLGRTYHLVATACKDGKVRIFKIKFDLVACVLFLSVALCFDESRPINFSVGSQWQASARIAG
jgi:nucleoporin SEH1